MNSNTSNPDEAENSTGKSMKKNIPGLALLLLDLAVALVGFYIGTHVFWKDQNEESVIVAGAMSAAWATFSWAVFGPMLGRDRSTKFEKGIFLMSMLASWDAGVAMACVNYGGKGTSLSWSGTSLWLLSVGFALTVVRLASWADSLPGSPIMTLIPSRWFLSRLACFNVQR